MYGCVNIKDISMLHNLKILIMKGCEKIKSIGNLKIKNISMSHNLKVLHYHGNRNKLEVGNLRNLEKIYIDRNIHGIHLLKKLKVLSMCKFTFINQRIIIKKNIKKLKEVNKNVKIIDYHDLECVNC